MGMSTYACHGDIIEMDTISQVCPDEVANFVKELEDNDMEFDVFASEMNYDGKPSEPEVHNAFNKLTDAFFEKTSLTINVLYHSMDDSGDEVDGGFLTIDNAFVKNPKLLKLERLLGDDTIVSRRFWTVFG